MKYYDSLRDICQEYYKQHRRYIDIFGELGELYAEEYLDLQRYKTNSKFCDGSIDGINVEIKTISPNKKKDYVRVQRSGSWQKVVIILFKEDYNVEVRQKWRKDLSKGDGQSIQVSWSIAEEYQS